MTLLHVPAGHTRHAFADTARGERPYVPGWQDSQPVDAAANAYCPAMQTSHALDPGLVEYSPRGHGVHVDDPTVL